jgi:hypothetical protein
MRSRTPNASGQRSQALVEFAIVAPILLLLLFGIVDFGRVVYTYVTLNQAVYEGARVAIRSSPTLPSNADVQSAVRRHAVDVSLANPCPNGPITSSAPPANQGWIYITEPDPPATPEAFSPTLQNAPGGEPVNTQQVGACSATNPAQGHKPLQVTIRFNFVPFTPLIRQLTANGIIISAAAVYSTEY